jgi:hypothetical protein
MNRGLLRSTAAASVLSALGSRARAAPRPDGGALPATSVCPHCGTACGVGIARRDGTVLAADDAPAAGATGACPQALHLPAALSAPPAAPHAPPASTAIAGVVLVTRPGAGPRVAARLSRAPGLTLAGGDGDARVGVVCEAAGAIGLELLGARLLADDPDLVGLHPTFVGEVAE